MLSNIELDVFDVRLLSSFWNLIIIQNAFRIIIWRGRFLWLCFPLLLVQHYHAHSQLSGLIENSVLISNYSRVTCRHFIPIPVIILCWPSWPVPGVSIYISIVSASPTAWRHESVAWYQLGPHETRNNLCWLQPVPKQQLCRYQPRPGLQWPLSVWCDLVRSPVLLAPVFRRPRPVLRTAAWWSSARRRCLGGGYEKYAAQPATPPRPDPSSSAFCAQLLLISTKSSDSSCDGLKFQKLAYIFQWRSIAKPSLIIKHWGSETVFIERWDGKDDVQLLSVCTLTHFFGNTFDDTFILLKRRKEWKVVCVHYGE